MKKITTILCITTLLLWFFLPAAQAQTQEIMEKNAMTEVCDFLKHCGVYYIATTEGDQPRVRPFGTSVIFEDRLYIQTGKRKEVAKQMLRNPKIEICAYDAAAGTWLRIAATVIPDERREAKLFMLDAYPMLKSMYSPDDDNTLVLYLSEATATFYSFGGEARKVRF